VPADEGTDSNSETESETEPETTPQAISTMKEILAELEQSHVRLRRHYERAKKNLAKERRRNWRANKKLKETKARLDGLMKSLASIIAG
jgi:molecular chaperone GrpE (heat shock protein)